MKKVFFVLILAIFYFSGSATAEIVETGKEVELKGTASKSFIYQALQPWIGHDASNIYFQKYKAKDVMMEGPRMQDIRVWIKEVKTTPNSTRYTHIIRFNIPYVRVVLDEKKELKAVDTLIYGVNMDNFTNYSNPDLISKSVKLFDFYHKNITE